MLHISFLRARVWQGLGDPVFAEQCKNAAITLYALGRANEGFQQGNSYGAPYQYNEETWTDDMEWGAAELYRLTGEKQYQTEAMDYARRAINTSWMDKDTAAHYQYYPFINLGHLTH